jgi:CRISPR-associated protein Cas2
MSASQWYLICYDVRDPKRLRKTAKHMEGYGQRMQYSVFRCWLSETQLQALRWELTSILDAEDDVLFIPLCDRCVEGICTVHSTTKEPDWPDAPPRFLAV